MLCAKSNFLVVSTNLFLTTILFYYKDWNILPPEKIKEVAAHVPTTVEELSALEILGEGKVEQYGERLIKQINTFIESRELQQYINERPKKRPKYSKDRPKSLRLTKESNVSSEGKSKYFG